MPRRLLALNVLLVAVSALCALYIARELLAPAPLPARIGRPPVTPPSAVAATTARPGPGAWTIVASRNLFSPTRSEAAASTVPGLAAPVIGKPSLYGVVLRDGAPIAYLEDPVTKRVAGYRIGDAIAGGTLQSISADSVVIARPDGKMDVRLHDPTRPRATTPVAGTPGAPAVPGAMPATRPPFTPGAPFTGGIMPGVIPPVTAVPQLPVPSGAAGVAPTAPRPLQPNLLRRMPTAPSDATSSQ